MNQLLDDRNHIEQVLQDASQTKSLNNELNREVQDLKDDKLNMSTQLMEEKRKVKEFESLLHENYEKQLSTKDTVTILQQQVQEERQEKSQLAARLQREQDSSARFDLRQLEDKNANLEREKKELIHKLSALEQLQNNLTKNMEFFEKDKSDSENKEKALSQRLKK